MLETNQEGSPSVNYPSNFPIPSPMVCTGDKVANWEFFRQQYEDYEIAIGLDKRSQKIRLATLRSVMGRECMQIFMNLKLTDDERKDVNTCMEALQAHFKPKWNVVYERYIFNLCSQNSDESIDEFLTRIRKLSSTREFSTLTYELICDKLVLGIRDETTKLRLLQEENLTLNKALNICRASEVANVQTKAMKASTSEVEGVNVLRTRPYKKVTTKPPTKASKATPNYKQQAQKQTNITKRKCYHCGCDQGHKLKECPAYGQTCNNCGKQNHFASVCLSSKSTRRIHALADGCKEETDEEIFQIEEVTSVEGQGRQVVANVIFLSNSGHSRTELTCQFDTGATCNVMSYDDLSRIAQDGNPQLQDSNVKLHLFDGSLMIPMGTTSLEQHRIIITNKQTNRIITNSNG